MVFFKNILFFAIGAVALLTSAQGNELQDSTRNFVDEVIYFVMTDRFSNGDASNDTGSAIMGTTKWQHGFDPTNAEFFHGGDLKGLIDRLDYIQGLGATAIWLTPVMHNKPVQGMTAGYHGYWIKDFLNVDPHLGTNDTFKEFVDAAHARGIRVFMDIIANHTADIIYAYENSQVYQSKDDVPFRDAAGNPFDDRQYAANGVNDSPFPELNPNTSFPYTPTINLSEQNSKNPDWLNNPIYYHNRGNSSFSGESSVYGDFYGLDDLMTAHPVVLEGLINVFSHWIQNYKIDGFRVDTVKHVNLEFWESFGHRLREVATEAGVPHFFLFGEVYDADIPFVTAFSTTGSLDANLDFGLAFALRDYLSKGAPSSNLYAYLDQDDLHTDADSSALAQPTFLGNHDMGRWAGFLRADNPTLSDQPIMSLWKTGYALLFFLRGQPVIYYGDEQGFFGTGGYSAAREDMFPSQTPSYMGANLIGTFKTPASDNFDPSHPLYIALSKMAEVYHSERILRHGAFEAIPSGDESVFAFRRFDASSGEEIIAVCNAHQSLNKAITLPTLPVYSDAQYEAIYSTEGLLPTDLAADDGSLRIEISPTQLLLFKVLNPTPGLEQSEISIAFSNLSEGDTLNGGSRSRDGQTYPIRQEVNLEIDADARPEVSLFLIENDGTSQFLGIDKAPPYRFFPNLSHIAPGTTFSLQAIASIGSTTTIAQIDDLQWGAVQLPDKCLVHFDPGNSEIENWRLLAQGAGLDGQPLQEIDFLIETEFGYAATIPVLEPNLPLEIQILMNDGQTLSVDRQFAQGHTIIPARTPHVFSKHADQRLYFREAAAMGAFSFNLAGFHAASLDLRLSFGDGSFSEWTSAIQTSNSQWNATIQIPTTDNPFFWNQPCQTEYRLDGSHRGTLGNFLPAASAFWWIHADQPTTIARTPFELENQVRLHYHRPDGEYGLPSSASFEDYWGLHVWQGAANPTIWNSPLKPSGSTRFGIFFDIPLTDSASTLAYIIHRGESKDPGTNQFLRLADHGHEVWQISAADPNSPYARDSAASVASANPTPLQSTARDANLILLNDQPLLRIQTAHGRLYTLKGSQDLLDWQPMGIVFEGDSSVQSISIPIDTGFLWYRIEIE